MKNSKIADLVLKSNAIFTGLTDKTIRGGIAVIDNRIVAVGNDSEISEWIGADTEVFIYNDELIMPGFNDSHFHLPDTSIFNNENYCLDLSVCKSAEECIILVQEFADKHPENSWIFGVGWNHWAWETPEMPNRKSLDNIKTDKPICLQCYDMHSVWINGIALELIGIDCNTENPEAGAIWKFEDGEPSGILSDTGAVLMATVPALNLPDDKLKTGISSYLKKASQLGITTIGDVYPRAVATDNAYDLYKELEDEERLSARIMFFPELKNDLEEAKALRERFNTEKVRFCGLKQLADGVLETHTALMVEPYTDDPSTRGELVIDEDVLRSQIINADSEGFSIRIHSIGDGTVRLCLNYFEEAQKLNGNKGLRHALEHIENIHTEDIPRFSELGVVASMQPIHSVLNFDGIPVIVGKERVQRAWAIKSLINAGARYSIGTDDPVANMNPFVNIFAAVTRTNTDGKPDGGFIPEEKLTIAEVLKGYTAGSAYVENFDHEIGTLEAGKLADIIVLSKNLFVIPHKEILDTKVKLTVMDGKVVHGE